jgi:hypothetical protein
MKELLAAVKVRRKLGVMQGRVQRAFQSLNMDLHRLDIVSPLLEK